MDRLLELGGSAPARRWVDLDGARLHLLEQGRGAPLLLLHGGGGGSANWYRLLPELSRSFRVIAPDLPGFGLSPAVPLRPPLGVQAALLLDRLLAALSLSRAFVLGTSFGGLAGLRLAQHFPARVERLVLLDSAGLSRSLPWVVRLGTRAPLGSWALRPSRGGTRWLLRRLLTSSRLEPADEDALVDYLAAVSQAEPPAAVGRFAGWRGQREVLAPAELRAIAQPVLLLWGAHDRFFPVAQAERAAACFTRGRLHVVAGAGHSPNWERPAEVLDQVTRFLAEPN